MRSVLLSLLVVVVGSVSGACTAGPGEAPTSSVAPSTTTTIPVTSAPTATTSIAPSTTTTIPVTSAPTTTTLPPSPSFENLGLAASWVVQLDDGVAFGVNESEQGFDLSGDGDTDDVVVHVVSDATVVNTGLQARWGVLPSPAVASSFRSRSVIWAQTSTVTETRWTLCQAHGTRTTVQRASVWLLG
ncbi:MAG: hypothetical protein WBP49_06825 [Acidimicrobiia bacterium]